MRTHKIRKGITLTELMVTISISTIVILAVAVALSDGQRAWGHMYGDINSEVAVQSMTACKRFDAVVRAASGNNCTIDPAGNWVEVSYYSSPDVTNVDRYARFTWQGNQLTCEYGSLGPKATIGIQTLCDNVTACKFVKVGSSVQMVLTLDDDTRSVTVASSNVMNNN
ncbi:MAG: prepilin-type N-terminal cleavage/methylation domain-containing protein [Sedimentisphaerales bacterium]|nr:prepilin-type N-terminal cleavage/methylation domain-containing protein [Sedimentisphaerales bacterium]